MSNDIPRTDVISADLTLAGFTDSGQKTGHVDLATQLPVGSIVTGWRGDVTTAFTGASRNVAPRLALGTPSKPDAYSASGAQQVDFLQVIGDTPVAGYAALGLGETRPVRVTIEDSWDFGRITAGAITIRVYFIRTEA